MNFLRRFVEAMLLKTELYEEVEADKTALGQAMAVVIISSIAAGIGNFFIGGKAFSIVGMISSIIVSLVCWYVWAFVTYIIGVKILPEEQTVSDHGELMRTIGFSSAPGIFKLFGGIPFLGWIINIIVSIWTLISMIIAVRQALDYKSTGRAVAVCLVGWVIQWGLMLFFTYYLLKLL